jgi:hypothetical protein
MQKLTRSDLMSLEEYSEVRPGFRQQIMAYKKNRQLPMGENARLYFEDRKTIHYQVQEILRVEKIFDAAGIEEELEAYNPLIPDGSNFKATFMLEYDDAGERQIMVTQLQGIEHKVWLRVEDCEAVYPIADEDLERDDGERTSTVHFLRFELEPTMVTALKNGSALYAGIDHPRLFIREFIVPGNIRDSLAGDLDDTALN